MNVDSLMGKFEIVESDFVNLSNLDFTGVYIIYDPKNENEVVYVGSAYARTIKERLSQYIKVNDTGNTLMYAICKKEYKVSKVKDITLDQREKAVMEIKTFKIKAIHYSDLEYQLIKDATPKYNSAGIDTTGVVVDETKVTNK